VAAIEALLPRGASLTARDRKGRAPLHVAAAYGRVGAIGALLAAGADVQVRLAGWVGRRSAASNVLGR
jgi:ankyrin repeat protein